MNVHMVEEMLEDWDGLIVGINCGEGSRSCERHDACGKGLSINSLIIFRDNINANRDECVAVIHVENGFETCTVGYPKCSVVQTHKASFVNKYCQVIEFFHSSTNIMKTEKINAIRVYMQ
mmetsp:Transcript_6283/g.9567  ORF Transcript_6283/g.9567 Transcript_6283/m.9567 type:complete len:120 (-) Transcript_6283:87-446(-)